MGTRFLAAVGFAAMVVGQLATAPVSAQNGQSEQPINVLVAFRNTPGANERARVRGAGGNVKRSFRLVRAVSASMTPQAIAALRANPDVLAIEPDGIVTALGTYDSELTGTWGVNHIGGGTAGDGGAGVDVAVIDTGVDCTHPELKRSGVTICGDGWDFVNNDNDPSDDNGHGTHVSGTIAAARDASGVVGVAPGVTIHPLKVLDASGSGSFSNIIAALEWAMDHHMQVTNNSYGSSSNPGSIVETAFINAYNAGVLSIAAAGNSGSNANCKPTSCSSRNDRVGYPARYASVVAVAATDSSDARGSFSSTGPEVELAAPGVSISSTVPGGGYATWSGTSMATPHVVGVAALVIASGITDDNHNGRINDEVRARLQSTAADLGVAGRDNYFGFGLVDAIAAVGEGGGGGGGGENTAPTVVISSPANGASYVQGTSVSFTGSASDTQDGNLSSSLTWTSNLAGVIGSGASFSTIGLGLGTHTITASVTDGGSLSGSASIQITITAPPTKVVRVSAITYATSGSRGRDLVITVTVLNQANAAVSGASVSLLITGPTATYTGTLVTNSTGKASAKITRAPSGHYASTVTALSAAGYTADTTTPPNGFNK